MVGCILVAVDWAVVVVWYVVDLVGCVAVNWVSVCCVILVDVSVVFWDVATNKTIKYGFNY